MKKLFCVLLTGAMVLSLAACGGSTEDSGTGEQKKEAEEETALSKED